MLLFSNFFNPNVQGKKQILHSRMIYFLHLTAAIPILKVLF